VRAYFSLCGSCRGYRKQGKEELFTHLAFLRKEFGLWFKPLSGYFFVAFGFSNEYFPWKKTGCEPKRGLLTTSPYIRIEFCWNQQGMSR
jgi:hypothetical protein